MGRTQKQMDKMANRILEAMEQGTVPWQKPWLGTAGPRSYVSGKPYNGVNALMTGMAMLENDYASPFWLTYNRARKYKTYDMDLSTARITDALPPLKQYIVYTRGHVRKGEKGTPLLVPKPYTKTVVDEKTGEEREERRVWFGGETVFNLDQCEGVPAPDFAEAEKTHRIERDGITGFISRFWGKLPERPRVQFTPIAQAYYTPTDDRINMPRAAKFASQQKLVKTLAHEFAHWTGHANRLDRATMHNYKMSKAIRGEEELIAEITAAQIMAVLGITDEIEDTAAYCESWLKPLEDNPAMIFEAAKQAQEILEWAGLGEAV